MSEMSPSLMSVFHGWEGYQASLVKAAAPLTPEQLAFRPTPEMRSVGEIVRHVALGRLNWFLRMHAPGSAELAEQIPEWFEDAHGNRYIVEEAVPLDAATLVHWLEASWKMVEATLTAWTVRDLETTYRHTFMGKTYAVSHQWTIWRIHCHDIHHGGQLTVLLAQQGIELPDLGHQGGHIVEIPLADPLET